MQPAGAHDPAAKHGAIAVDLATGHHLDAKGVDHRTGAHDPANIQHHTMIFDHGQVPMQWKHHLHHKTPTYHKVVKRARNKPVEHVVRKALPALLAEAQGIPVGAPLPGLPAGGPGMPPMGAPPPGGPLPQGVM